MPHEPAEPAGPDEVYVTRPEAARRLGTPFKTIKRATEMFEIHCYYIGGWPQVKWEDAVRWWNQRFSFSKENP